MAVQRPRRGHAGQRSRGHHADSIGQLEQFVEIVRDEQHAHTFRDHAFDLTSRLGFRSNIDACRWLVEHRNEGRAMAARARSTFCALPPLSSPTIRGGLGGRIRNRSIACETISSLRLHLTTPKCERCVPSAVISAWARIDEVTTKPFTLRSPGTIPALPRPSETVSAGAGRSTALRPSIRYPRSVHARSSCGRSGRGPPGP
jgi:hypothetical protein